MPSIFYVLSYENVMIWRALRQPTVRARALEKPPEVTDSETADLRNAPGQNGGTPAI